MQPKYFLTVMTSGEVKITLKMYLEAVFLGDSGSCDGGNQY